MAKVLTSKEVIQEHIDELEYRIKDLENQKRTLEVGIENLKQTLENDRKLIEG